MNRDRMRQLLHHLREWRALRRYRREAQRRRRRLGLSAQRIARRDRDAWGRLSHGPAR